MSKRYLEANKWKVLDKTAVGLSNVQNIDTSVASNIGGLTPNRVLLSDVDGKINSSIVSTTTLDYLDVTSSIQTQLNNKALRSEAFFYSLIF